MSWGGLVFDPILAPLIGWQAAAWLAALVAVPVGLAVGLLTGPLWFHFISTEAARCLGENVAERMVGALP